MSDPRLVLLVDDDPDLLVALSGALRRSGYEVVTALDAVAAMRIAVSLKPHAVVLDVGLPGGEGATVMRRMHALPQLAGVPIVIMSGRDPERYRDDALSAGAVAYLTKPVEADELATVLRGALGEDDSDASGSGRRVLLVDDDEDLLIVFAAPLRRRGFDVMVATDAVTAVAAAVKEPPDVIVMDLGLPGGDGLTVMQRLHALPQLSAVPVVVITGHDPAARKEACLAAGAAAYLVKPVVPDQFTSAVVDALGDESS